MKQKNIVLLVLIAIIIAASFYVFARFYKVDIVARNSENIDLSADINDDHNDDINDKTQVISKDNVQDDAEIVEFAMTSNNNSDNMIIQFIENASLEESSLEDSNLPKNFTSNSWGNNSSSFTYLNDGYNSDHSIKIEVSDYIDGDVKWYFTPIELASGDYTFSDYYRSDTDSKVVLAISCNDGTNEYINLANAPASDDWTKYESSFEMPKHGKSITVYHLLSQDGYLITDDYQISSYNYEGFSEGLLTISFDDGWMDNYQTALPIMQKFGYKSNQFYATTYIQNAIVENPKEMILPFVDAGHEMGSHSINHYDLSTLSDQELTAELAESKSFLEDYLGTSIDYFAAPYGIYDSHVNENILTHYQAHRTVDFGYNSKDNFDVAKLTCMPVVSSTTLEEVEEWVKKAKDENLWLILTYHNIKENPGDYGTTPELFTKQMQIIKDTNIPVVTLSQAITKIQTEIESD